MQDNQQLKDALKKFKTLIKTCEDKPQNSYYFSEFIRYFIKVKPPENFVLPTIEIMTVLKHEKPQIFHQLKSQGSYNSLLDFVTQITIDIEEAAKRLIELNEKLK